MKDLFTSFLEVGLSGSVIICLVLLLRLVLKKAPRRIICFLWLLAGLRLLVPFQFESSLSLQPQIPVSFDSIVQEAPVPSATQEPFLPGFEMQTATVPQDTAVDSMARPGDYIGIAACIWAAGLCAMVLYAIVSYLRFRRKVAEAVRICEGIWESGGIETAFLMGFITPRIYLPTGLSAADRAFILSHERTHMERGDNWWRLLGFLCLSIHWFNPLVWLGFAMLNRDVEMACDEKVVRFMDVQERKAYSAALLACSTGRHRFSACPVAFGEVSVKQRILNVLNYRKPGFWVCLVSVLALGAVAMFFLTSPVTDTAAQKLRQCEDALKNWQSRDAYHITVDNQFEGDVLHNSSFEDYWASGEDWQSSVHLPGVNGDSVRRNMETNGTQFSRESWTSGEDAQPGDTGWVETEFSPYDVYTPWPMIFDWDDYLMMYESSETAEDLEVITLTAVPRPGSSKAGLLCTEGEAATLQFYFSSDGTLHHLVQVTSETTYYLEGNEKVLTAKKVTSTAHLIPNDPEHIDQTLQIEYVQATRGY